MYSLKNNILQSSTKQLKKIRPEEITMRPHLPILLMLFLMINTAAQADVIPTSGKYYETTEDIKVKVMGGFLTLQRTWIDGQWHFNRHWNRLRIVRNLEDNSIKEIDRNGDIYVKADDAGKLFRFGKKETIAVTESGYRWQDRKGNWINFDSEGYFLKYGDRNNVSVTLQYDEQKRLSGVLDHFNEQMLWYSYNEQNQLVEIHDYTQRKVRYAYTGDKLSSVFDLRGNEWKYAYGGNNLISKTDPENHATQFSYNANNQLIKIEDELGVWREYGYDYDKTKDEFYFWEKDSESKTQENWYDSKGSPVKVLVNGNLILTAKSDGESRVVNDQGGGEERINYDEFGNIESILNFDGSVNYYKHEIKFSNIQEFSVNGKSMEVCYYDSRGNLIEKIKGDLSKDFKNISYEYDQFGNQIKIIEHGKSNSDDAITYNYYDEKGNLTSSIDPEGRVETKQYNAKGDLSSHTDANGYQLTKSYDNFGNLLEENYHSGRGRSLKYNKIGLLVEESKSDLLVKKNAYNSRGFLVKSAFIDGSEKVYRRDGEGRLLNILDEEGVVPISYKYDLSGRISSISEGNNNSIVFEYSGAWGINYLNPIRVSYSSFVRNYYYDRNYRISSIKDFSDNGYRSVEYGYDYLGRLAVKKIGDKSELYLYDSLNNLIKVTYPSGRESQYAYDTRGNLIKFIDASGSAYGFSYDKSNLLVKSTRPMGQFLSFEYDRAKNLISVLDQEGKRSVFEFDTRKNIVSIEYFDDKLSATENKVLFSYNDLNKLSSYSDFYSGARYMYDNRERKIKESFEYNGRFVDINYTFYKNGLRKSMEFPDGDVVHYRYDASNKISYIGLSNGESINFVNYNWNNIAKIAYPGGVLVGYSYDSFYRLSGMSLSFDNLNSSNVEYGYDEQDNLISRRDSSDFLYFYDHDNRIERVQKNGVDVENYDYDDNGNILAGTGMFSKASYNSNNEIYSADEGDFSFNKRGELVSHTKHGITTNFSYNIKGDLIGLKNDTLKLKISYDPFSRPVTKNDNGKITYFLNNDDGLVAELDDDLSIKYKFGFKPGSGWNTDPVFLKKDTMTYYYNNDYQKKPRVIFDSHGKEVWKAEYSSYGIPYIKNNLIESGFRLSGQYDVFNGVAYHNLNRVYIPSIGRYIQTDPLSFVKMFELYSGNLQERLSINQNGYSYANDNPVNRADPYGLFDELNGWDLVSSFFSCSVFFGVTVPNPIVSIPISLICTPLMYYYGPSPTAAFREIQTCMYNFKQKLSDCMVGSC